jgi:hypothetical protein
MQMVDRHFTEKERRQIDLAALLVEQINKSVKIANESKVRATRVSRARVAEDKLAALAGIAAAYPFLKLQRVDEVRETIATIKRETDERYPSMTPYGDLARANSDIVAGLRFRATLQLRTPLYVLKRHGALHTDLKKNPPAYAREKWQGIWVPETKGWEELGGVAGPELSSTMVATDLGPMEDSGDAYYRFLFAVRTIAADRGKPLARRRIEVAEACTRPEWAGFAAGHGGPEAVAWKVS